MALALYRTYRPGTLAEVIGQEHVTQPLARALDAGRVHHAYLFSGPRGCGKTSTARILARSLNCAEGPSSTPCGSCRSCIELAPNGPGSIDVVEMDAATHRGIDDARELREKAVYAPAASPYKVYIIDEAHQLTNEAANALLKLVEEPPAHLRFVFATTEPDKIITTIRSRTFHYGFRLVPARVLSEHLDAVCRSEGVPAEPAALGVVARAGAGSVRDSLSVLGQLLAGTGPDGVTYGDAVAMLGLTDAALIDAFVEALIEGSAAQMFVVVDSVISAGHDPRRFVADVLDRLRDLIVLRADPTAGQKGLLDVPDDAAESLAQQAQSLGLSELSHAADVVSAGLGEIKGATAPRLQLELLCARLTLPGAEGASSALSARVDRLERWAGRLGSPGGPPGGEPSPAPAQEPARATAAPAEPAGSTRGPRVPQPPAAPAPPRRPTLRSTAPADPPAPPPAEPPGDAPAVGPLSPAGERPEAPERTGERGAAPAPDRARGQDAQGSALGRVSTAWPAILERLAAGSRVAWTAFHSATPLSVTDGVLAVALAESGNIRAIAQRGHDERLRQAILDVVDVDVTIDVVHSPDAVRVSTSRVGAAAPPPGGSAAEPRRGDAVRRAQGADPGEPVDVPSDDDPDIEDAVDGMELITRELGARPIGEIDHS